MGEALNASRILACMPSASDVSGTLSVRRRLEEETGSTGLYETSAAERFLFKGSLNEGVLAGDWRN